jgi:three-Cys-motif partner protein
MEWVSASSGAPTFVGQGSMKKHHQANEVGPWAAIKLKALEDYLNAYSVALKKQSFTRVYIDAFAGACVSKIRSAETSAESGLFFNDDEDAAAQDQFIIGSPIRALSIPNGFHQHHFFDLDESRAATLASVAEDFSSKVIKVQVGDSNPAIQLLCSSLSHPNIRGVAFLDPYGPHLEWETVRALANTKNFEVIINFPLGMAINRLISKSGIVNERWEMMLNKCFGTPDWRAVAYESRKDLFGEITTSKNEGVAERLLQLYLGRLREIFKCVATPRLIRNTKGAPLYYLIWAGPHGLGAVIADHILSQGEKLPREFQKRV